MSRVVGRHLTVAPSVFVSNVRQKVRKGWVAAVQVAVAVEKAVVAAARVAAAVVITNWRRVFRGAVVMNKGPGQDGLNYQIVCNWCGVIIRHHNVRESFGMCLKCYARVFSQHAGPYRQTEKRFEADARGGKS